MTILAPIICRASTGCSEVVDADRRCAAETADRIEALIRRAAELRAAWAARRFEEASAAYVGRHLRTSIRATDSEKDHLRALHADVLETAAVVREQGSEPHGDEAPTPSEVAHR